MRKCRHAKYQQIPPAKDLLARISWPTFGRKATMDKTAGIAERPFVGLRGGRH